MIAQQLTITLAAKRLSIPALPLFATGLISFTAWLVYYAHPSSGDRTIRATIVIDSSTSLRSACSSTVGIAEKLLSRTLEYAGAALQITLIVTGDTKTGHEPQLAQELSFASTGRVIEGRRRLEEEKTKFLQTIQQKCEATRSTEESPIFVSVRRAVEDMRTKGGTELYIITDLEENIDQQIKQALRQRVGAKSLLPAKIQSQSFTTITFCGYAEVNGHLPRNTFTGDRLREVWSELFTSSVDFAPFCRKPSTGVAQSIGH